MLKVKNGETNGSVYVSDNQHSNHSNDENSAAIPLQTKEKKLYFRSLEQTIKISYTRNVFHYDLLWFIIWGTLLKEMIDFFLICIMGIHAVQRMKQMEVHESVEHSGGRNEATGTTVTQKSILLLLIHLCYLNNGWPIMLVRNFN
ncbi:hypothetical protein BpHYR1_021984 [Brachionus plicatilis]|uniref:Uncharacterized protein n=1 Tax=Brachionus plicatilis TaxID=10195 RepID=A0A3M7Q4Z2_BRAPC|nr:hypothetical protein BpHYR1_021984 [Brachionus plicatilis]